ncbi:MAG: lactate racemase domain-containing protein [Blastocatellales bacterium]
MSITPSLSSLSKQMLVEARLENHRLHDTAAETSSQLSAVFSNVDLTGRAIAVAVGSRGIDQLATVVSATIAKLKSLGARPFIFPAMGSHGGATAEGQRDVLATLGVTEESAGAPINSSMETVEIGRTENGVRVHVSRPALEADAILLINRVKPHTDFASEQIGSGLRKMLLIGLGKTNGAFECHHHASRRGYEPVLLEVSDFVLNNLQSVFGLALIEDGYHKLSRIEAIAGPQFASREPELFKQARAWMARLPFEQIDVLVVDEMGKNISGSGMDPNVIGRRVRLESVNRRQEVGAIYVRGLTPETHGNAIGIGLADVTSARLVNEMDKLSTYTNALSAMSTSAARIPMYFANDNKCLSAALRLAGADPAEARIVRIKNTLALDRLVASSVYAPEIAGRDDLSVLQSPRDWRFAADGDFNTDDDLLN